MAAAGLEHIFKRSQIPPELRPHPVFAVAKKFCDFLDGVEF